MNTIVLDSYDKAAFNDIKDQTPALQNLEEEGVSVNLGFPELMEDVYGSLYKYNPEVKDPIDQGSMANKTIMEQLMQSREYNELREFTRLQEFESAVGVRSFSEHIISEIPEEMNKMANEMSVTQSMLDRLLEEYDPNAQDNPNPGLIKQAKEKLDNLQGQMKQYTQKHEDEIRQMVRTAIQKGADDAKQVQGFMNTFGSEPGQVCQLPMKEKISMAEKVLKNKSLHKLAEMAGRFQRLALHYQSSKVKHGADEIVDTELGNNLNRIVPSELIYLDDPDLESLFYLKYSQRNLLQFKMEGKDKKAKGPIIICIDNSGSMQRSREQIGRAHV